MNLATPKIVSEMTNVVIPAAAYTFLHGMAPPSSDMHARLLHSATASRKMYVLTETNITVLCSSDGMNIAYAADINKTQHSN